jgi:hypothetical protein
MRGVILIGGRFHVSKALVQPTEPYVRVSVRRKIAPARRGCHIRPQEPVGVGKVPIGEHERDSSVIRKPTIGRPYTSSPLDHAGELVSVSTVLVEVRHFQIWIDLAGSQGQRALVVGLGFVQALLVARVCGAGEMAGHGIDCRDGLNLVQRLVTVPADNPRSFEVKLLKVPSRRKIRRIEPDGFLECAPDLVGQ